MSNSASYLASRSLAFTSIHWLSATGLLNTVYSFWVWFTYLNATYTVNTTFWYSIFTVCFVHGALWMPLGFHWPAVASGGRSMIKIVDFLTWLTLLGPFFLYPANIGFMIYTFFIAPDSA